MSKKDKELTEIVAEVLIELHEHKTILDEHTIELHFQREQQEKLMYRMDLFNERLDGLNDKVDKNQTSTEHVINTMFNVVLDKLDNITGELKTINTRLTTVEEKIDNKKN